MADNKPSTPTTPTTPTLPTTAIPMGSKYHWWYDSKSAGVSNSPPANMTGRSPMSNYSALSQSPPGESFNTPMDNKRRDSLKNMVHLCDFATP